MKKAKLLIPLTLSLLLAGCTAIPAQEDSSGTSDSTFSSIEVITSINLADAEGKTSGTISVGETLEISAKISGALASALRLTSSDPSVAGVAVGASSTDASGVSTVKVSVTAYKAGNANITASVGDKSATFAVTVSNVEAEGVSIDGKDSIGNLPMRRKTKLSATVSPANTTANDITWSSSDATVASVTKDGTVIGVKQGEATITAQCGDKSDSVVIKVTDPIIKADEVSNLPASYKASLTHSYNVPVTHVGDKATDAYSFALNSSVALKDSSGADTETSIPTMKIAAANVTPNENTVYSGFFVQFNITTAGTYSIFTKSSHEPSIKTCSPVEADGTIGSATSIYKYDNGNDAIGKMFSARGDDAHYEMEFAVGTYVINIGGWGSASDLELGIVKVTTSDEATTVDTPVVTATGDPAYKTISDNYSATYISKSILFNATDNFGFIQVGDKGYRFDYDSVENEYVYNSTLGDEGSIDDYFSWKAILSDSKIKWASTNEEEHHDVYYVNLSDTSIDASPVINFAQALGIYGVADGIYVVSDYANNTVSFSVAFDDGSDAKTVDVSIEAATESPVTVKSYDVTHGGEAGSGSGVDDNWDE